MNKYCANGSVEGVKSLMLKGANLEVGDYDGRTPLHLAASEGHLNMIKFMIETGLKNLNPLDRWGNTPLDDAKRGKFKDVIVLLSIHGAKTKQNLQQKAKAPPSRAKSSDESSEQSNNSTNSVIKRFMDDQLPTDCI